jgi:transcriptional regulator with XRE-family HTH domain
MTLGERLRIAREHAGLSQEELGAKACCGQGVVSKIERGDQDSTGYVVKLATACGVRPEWLDDEQGEMIDGLYVSDPRLKHMLTVAQALPDYAIDRAVKGLDTLAEHAREAEAAASAIFEARPATLPSKRS